MVIDQKRPMTSKKDHGQKDHGQMTVVKKDHGQMTMVFLTVVFFDRSKMTMVKRLIDHGLFWNFSCFLIF